MFPALTLLINHSGDYKVSYGKIYFKGGGIQLFKHLPVLLVGPKDILSLCSYSFENPDLPILGVWTNNYRLHHW